MGEKYNFESIAARRQAVYSRDPRADGAFVYGVKTTGIFCRPTCTSRRPKRENVVFFNTADEAVKAGYRACKRCEPQSPSSPNDTQLAIEKACRILTEAERAPTLRALADAVGLSPSHFQRQFKKMMGVSPKQFAMQQRENRMREILREQVSVADAVFAAGYESGSRFYARSADALGMTPTEYRNGGAGVAIRFAVVECFLGWMLVAATNRGLCRIQFGDTAEDLKAHLRAEFPAAILRNDDPEFVKMVAQTVAFLNAPQQGLSVPLDVQGTAFQRRVWLALQAIPAGKTATYGEIAAKIGNPRAARAVAQACAANPVAVAIPCHRVVRADGTLGGYRWGTDRKRELLAREAEGKVISGE